MRRGIFPAMWCRFPVFTLMAISAFSPGFCDDFSPVAVMPPVYSGTRPLKFIRIKEALDTLEQVFGPEKSSIRFSVPADETIHFESADARLVAKADGILREIDAPNRCVNLFVRLDHLCAISASTWLQEWKMPGKTDDFLQIIPDPRTNRVFLMGTPSDMTRAAGFLRAFDKLQGAILAVKVP